MSEKLPLPRTTQPVTGFDGLWLMWPRKVAKGAGRAAYRKAIKKVSHGEIEVGVKKYIAANKRTELEFIPYLATWLNGERWEDEIKINETRLRNDL